MKVLTSLIEKTTNSQAQIFISGTWNISSSIDICWINNEIDNVYKEKGIHISSNSERYFIFNKD
jgi:hypothetical protein